MTTSLNASRHIDRISADLLLAVNAAAVELEISYCVVGAFARDVVLGCCYGINTGQATRDIDFGLMLDNWTQFQTLRSHLLQRHDFAEFRGIAHRLAFRGVRELDIVPFGGLERRPGEIAWPPDFSIVIYPGTSAGAGMRTANHRSGGRRHSVRFPGGPDAVEAGCMKRSGQRREHQGCP